MPLVASHRRTDSRPWSYGRSHWTRWEPGDDGMRIIYLPPLKANSLRFWKWTPGRRDSLFWETIVFRFHVSFEGCSLLACKGLGWFVPGIRVQFTWKAHSILLWFYDVEILAETDGMTFLSIGSTGRGWIAISIKALPHAGVVRCEFGGRFYRTPSEWHGSIMNSRIKGLWITPVYTYM